MAGNTTGIGGGIFSFGTLELTRCTIRRSHTSIDGAAGGIHAAGTTTLTNCVIEDNDAGGAGGIVVSGGVTTLAGNTVVRGNHVPGAGANGGGKLVDGTLNGRRDVPGYGQHRHEH